MLIAASRGAGPGPTTLSYWRLLAGHAIPRTQTVLAGASCYATKTLKLPSTPGAVEQQAPHSRADGSRKPGSSRSANESQRSTKAASRIAVERQRSSQPKYPSDSADGLGLSPTKVLSRPAASSQRSSRFKYPSDSPKTFKGKTAKQAKPFVSNASLAKLNHLSELPDDPSALADLLTKSSTTDDKLTVLRAWKKLRQLEATNEIKIRDYFTLGTYIARTFAASSAKGLFTQAQYIDLEDIAVEAAARDAWKGLYTLSLAAIGFGRPEKAANAFERYKERVFMVQGKSRTNGDIRDKTARLSTRLDGYGPRPLTFAYLLAMMRLNQIDGKVIMSVLETRRPLFTSPEKLIDHVLAPLLSNLPRTEQIVVRREYKKLIEMATFVLMVWHPQALLRTMRDLDFNQDWVAMRRLYNNFLKLSIGPNKLIHAYDLNVSEQIHYEEVPFTTPVWLRFIVAMKRSGDLRGLQDMLEQEMPARKLVPTSRVLRAFMIAFSYIAIRAESPLVVRQRAARLADDLWRRVERSGTDIDDELLSARIDSLAMYDAQSVPQLHLQIEKGVYPRAGSVTQRCLIGYHMRQRNSDVALEMIRAGLEGRGICRPGRAAFANIIKLAALYETGSREVVVEVMSLKPPDIVLSADAIGLILAHMLHWGFETSAVIDRFRHSIVQNPKLNSIDVWEDCLTSILTRRQEKHETTAREFMVAIRILGFPREEMAHNVTHYTGQLLWGKIVRRIIASNLPAETRAELLELCIEQFPAPGTLHFLPERFMAIVESALIRPQRDRISEAEGLVEWYIERGKIFPGERRIVMVNYILLCVRHGELGLALNMLDKPDVGNRAARDAAKTIITQVTRGKLVDNVLLDKLRTILAGKDKAKVREEVAIDLDIDADDNARVDDIYVDSGPGQNEVVGSEIDIAEYT